MARHSRMEPNHPKPDKCTFSLPEEMPVMVLTDCFLFPGCFLPLFIFEERYCQMLKHALATNRMFCVGTRLPNPADESEIMMVSTAGLIRSCVSQADGTSHLMLMGMQRIKLTGWVQEKPFRIAKVEPIATREANPSEVALLRDEALQRIPPCPNEAATAMASLREQLRQCGDPELICDILIYHFVRRSPALRAALNECCLIKRYKLLIDELSRCKH